MPREAVDAPILTAFKAMLEVAVSNLAEWKMSQPLEEDWNWMTFKVPPTPNYSVILYKEVCLKLQVNFKVTE